MGWVLLYLILLGFAFCVLFSTFGSLCLDLVCFAVVGCCAVSILI